MRIFCLLLLILSSFHVLSSAKDYDAEIIEYQDKIESQREQMLKLSKEMELYKTQLKKLSKDEKSVLRKVDGLTKNINTKKIELMGLEEKLQEAKSRISSLEKELQCNLETAKDYSEMLSWVLASYHSRKKKAHIFTLTDLITDPPTRAYCCAYVGAADISAAGIESTTLEIDRIKSLSRELKQEREKQVQLKKEVIAVQNIFIDQRKEQLQLVKDITARKHLKKEELKKLLGRQEKLQELVSSLKVQVTNLERLKMLSKDFVKAKGNLPWPLKGELSSRFGKQKHPELDTMIFNRGIKIRNGQDIVKVVAAGEVVFADKFTDMGNMVIVDHGGDYYTIYGALAELVVSSGQELEPFTQLGKTSGELYFEIGKGSSPEDPLKWLKN
jgi:septal ring factor EnvC (AmiA/AmiB activator)